MKTNKNTNKTMSALQFMKEFENTQKIMESIADATAVERKALLESGFGGPSADDNGIFDMNSLLDVEVSDKPENQPRYYNSPVDPLNDSDKALIVDAFAKKLEEMKSDVMDFSDIGPIATVIKDNYGFKQDIEKFLQDTIQKTSNWMTQQNNTEANTNGVAEVNDGGPTDIKPQTSGIDGGDMGMGGEGIPAMEEVPVLTDTVAEDIVPPAPELGGDVGMGDEGMDLGLGEDVPPVGGEDMPPVGDDEGMDLGLGEDVPPVGGDDMPPVGDDEGVPPVGDDVGDDVPAIEDETPAEEKKEEKKEGDKEEGEEKEDDKETDELLESIMTDYQKSSKAKESVNAINESVEKSKAVKAQLEAISNTYHSKENAKVEAIKQDKMIKAQLESISSNYKATVNAKLEAIEKEKEIDSKLNQLLESHKQKTSTDGKSNLTARLEAKDKIEKLTK